MKKNETITFTRENIRELLINKVKNSDDTLDDIALNDINSDIDEILQEQFWENGTLTQRGLNIVYLFLVLNKVIT